MLSEDDDQVKRLIQTRRGNRSAITRLEKEVLQAKDAVLTPNILARINSISVSVSQKQKYLAELDEKILEKIPLEQIEREIDDAMDWTVKLTEIVNLIEEIKKSSSDTQTSHSAEATAPVAVDPGSSNVEATSPHDRSYSSVSSVQGVRLPKLELPKFNGDITMFNSFWQAFDCAIHSNENLPDIHKLNYLMNLLEGPAHRVVAGLQLTEENYKQAVESLKLRFGGKQRIISAHMQSLLKLQDCPNEKVSQLRYIYDKINVHVRGLESLGMSQESYGGLLIPIIMQQMPRDITIQVARKVTEDIWPIKEILEIIRNEIEAREIGDSVNASKQVHRQMELNPVPRKTIPTTKSFVANDDPRKVKCYFCSKDHLTINCVEVSDLAQRKTILQRAKRCFKCLKLGHISKNCDRKCRKCGYGHHQVLCTKPYESKAPEGTDQLVTATVKGKKEVLLQTARAYAYGNDETKKIPIDILFDSGSQRSYVSEEVKKKLSLNANTVETININTFGSAKYERKNCELVEINVEVDDQVIPVSALSYNKICSPFSTRSVNLSDYPHLRNLKLADSIDSQTKRISLLIGADYYYDFIVGNVVKGNTGPVAVKSKLGWLLSGPYSSNSKKDSNVISNLTLDCYPQQFTIYDRENQEGSGKEDLEIQQSVKDFWKHEALGIEELVEGTTTESVNKPKEFNIEHNGNRYEVSLPWRSDLSNECLSDNYQMCLKRLGSLQYRLKQDPKLLEEYDSIFKEQLKNGIIEYVPENQLISEKTHFLCHHAVVRKDHDTTKIRIVFDGSAKSQPDKLSLNDSLELGENFMPSLFDTILRFRVYPVALTADIEKAFLQIGIKPADRDSLRFLWYDDVKKENPSVVQLRWTRIAFGLKPSPLILGATIKQHVSLFQD